MELTKSARDSLPRAVGVVLLVLSLPGWARADDVTTLSGTTYHAVRLVRVQPDGVVWEHSTGMAMVNFTDLPEAVRRQYHYDAGKAAEFVAAQAQEREKSAAQAQQAQREAAVHRVQRFERTEAASGAAGQPGTFVYHRDRATEALTQSLGEQIAARKQAEAKFHEDDGTVWDRRIWYIPRLITGGYSDGHAFDPPTKANPLEFQSSAHHAPGGFASDSAHDPFFQPIYQTKSYNEEVDRSEALTHGKP